MVVISLGVKNRFLIKDFINLFDFFFGERAVFVLARLNDTEEF